MNFIVHAQSLELRLEDSTATAGDARPKFEPREPLLSLNEVNTLTQFTQTN